MPSLSVREEREGTGEAPLPEPSPVAPSTAQSLQLQLSPAQQEMIVQIVLDDFETAKRQRDEADYGFSAKGEKLSYDTWLKELEDLYFGRRQPKTEPWQYASNRSMMIAMAILEVLHARMFPAVYNEELVNWRPVKTTSKDRAERVNKLMFWWIRVRAHLRDFFDRWVRQAIGYGRVVSETFFEVQYLDKGEMAPAEPSTAPDGSLIETPPEPMLELYETTRSDLIQDQQVFLLKGASDLQRDPVLLKKSYSYRQLVEMEQQDQALNVTFPAVPPGQSLRELLQPVGVAASGELSEEVKEVKRRNMLVDVIQAYTAIDLNGDGFPEPIRVLIAPLQRLYLGGLHQRDLSKRGLRHLDLTIFIPRLDDPQGTRGLGVLEQVKEMALEIDAIFNQMTDANTLQIMRPGFYDPHGDLDAAAMKLAPRIMTPLPNPQQSVYYPEINIPTERLINAVRLVLEFIERLTAASSYVMGKESEIVGGSGTATRTNAIVGAANERHSIPVQALRQGAARILTYHLDLLLKHLEPGLESRILGEEGEPIFGDNELSQDNLAGEYDALLAPDDSMGSKETRRQLTQIFYDVLMGNPIVLTDPAKVYTVTADWLRARGYDPEVILGPAPAINDALTPADEHTLIMAGDFAKVQPTVLQNPIQHLMEHMAFLQDPMLAALAPALQEQVRGYLMQHIQATEQMMAMMAQMTTQMRKGGGNNAPQPRGAAPGGRARPEAVGPESSMASPRQPLAQALQATRGGESQRPA